MCLIVEHSKNLIEDQEYKKLYDISKLQILT